MKNKKNISIFVTIIIILFILLLFLLPKNKENNTNIITQFFPTISNILNIEDIPIIGSRDTNIANQEDLKLYKISNHISSDFLINNSTSTEVVFQNPDSEDIILDLNNFIITVEKNTGHLYFYDLKTRELTRLTNTTISNVSNIYSGFNGDRFYVYIKSLTNNGGVETYSYNFNPNDLESRATNATKLNSFINIVASAENNIYWENTTNGNILKDTLDLSAGEIILSNNQIDWRYTATDDYLLVSQKPSSKKETSAYKVVNNVLEKVISNKTGLTVLPSPDGKYILYTTGGNSINTFLYDTENKQEVKLSFSTPVEKCTWSTKSTSLYCSILNNNNNLTNYPDDWYSGSVNLNNNHLISLNINNPIRTFPIIKLGDNLDINKINISNDSKILILKDKNNDSLWVLNLVY